MLDVFQLVSKQMEKCQLAVHVYRIATFFLPENVLAYLKQQPPLTAATPHIPSCPADGAVASDAPNRRRDFHDHRGPSRRAIRGGVTGQTCFVLAYC